MPAPADKYPPMPAGVSPFEWIVRTAEQLRRRQTYATQIIRSRQAAERRAVLKALPDPDVEPRPGQYWKAADR